MNFIKDLPKGWKWFLTLCGTLASIAAGIEGWHVIKGELTDRVEKIAQPYVKMAVKAELADQKRSKESSYRYQKSHALGVPMDSLLIVDKIMYEAYRELEGNIDSVNLDRSAVSIYLQVLSAYIWRELEQHKHKDVIFGISKRTGLTFYMYKGFIFEAYYKGSTDSYWFKDAYNVERECK